MALSVSLLRHRIAARSRARRSGDELAGERPPGRLIWVHFGRDAAPAGALMAIERLVAANGDLSVLTTGRGEDPPGPADTPQAATGFLDHWRPDIALFVGTDFYPCLWAEALGRGLPLFAAETRTARHPTPLMRGMSAFDAVIAIESDARLGPAGQALGPLSTVPAPPPAATGAVERMKEALETRPIWLALDVPASEVAGVLVAHAAAAHHSHRLVLILAPSDGAAGAAREALAASGHRVVSRLRDELPGPEDKVILADAPQEAGIWLRLAPATYLGSTIAGEGPAASPFGPVSLGSALVHGPRTGRAEAVLRRLRRGGAARAVPDATALADAIDALMSPEAAAEMARAGWSITSEGADASARLVEVIEDTLAGIDV